MATYLGYNNFNGTIFCKCGSSLNVGESKSIIVCAVCGTKYLIECMYEIPEETAPVRVKILDIPNLAEQMKNIPQQNFLHADRYDTEDQHVIHLWDDVGHSYDISYPKSV